VIIEAEKTSAEQWTGPIQSAAPLLDHDVAVPRRWRSEHLRRSSRSIEGMM
jgi:hypothetical protein